MVLQDDVRVCFRRAGPRLWLRRRGRKEETLPGFRISSAATQVLIGRDRAAPLSQYIRLSITRPLSIGHRRVSICFFVDWTTLTYCSAIVDRATPMHYSGDCQVLTAVYIIDRLSDGQRRRIVRASPTGQRQFIFRAIVDLDNAVFYSGDCQSDDAETLFGRSSIRTTPYFIRAIVDRTTRKHYSGCVIFGQRRYVLFGKLSIGQRQYLIRAMFDWTTPTNFPGGCYLI